MPCPPGRPAKSPHTLAVFCSVITFSYVLNEKILMTDTSINRLYIIQVDVFLLWICYFFYFVRFVTVLKNNHVSNKIILRKISCLCLYFILHLVLVHEIQLIVGQFKIVSNIKLTII